MSDDLPQDMMSEGHEGRGAAGMVSSPFSATSPPPRTSSVQDPVVEEELVDDRMGLDYRAIPELDVYQTDEKAEAESVGDMSEDARRQAEREIRRRERRTRGRGADDFTDDDDEASQRAEKRARMGERELLDAPVNLEDHDGPVREWISLERPRQEVKRRFGQFLRTFVGRNDVAVYPNRIIAMARENKESLLVSYHDLSSSVPLLAIWMADCPVEMLKLFDEEATRITIEEYFEHYENVAREIHVRITDLPIVDNIRDLRQVHLNVLIRISGVVTRRSSVFPQLRVVYYNCMKCGYVVGPYTQNNEHDVMPTRCPECQETGPFSINHESTIYRNYQKLTLQESPGTVPPGRIPRQKEVILLHDLIDTCRPGEEVDVTGVYTNNFDSSLNTRNGFPVFRTVVEANYVGKRMDKLESFHITVDDKKAIHELSKRPNVAQLLFNSIGPSIYGHEDIKMALALSMFGGVPKHLANKHRIRGDINVLVMGDPGTGKSQFLKYVEKTAHRAVFTTGKGASAVGLTASVHRDPMTREWTLEGGALVLADEGVCLIDEFDKMNDQDRTSIHEAMEQQSISISKAGIVTTLQARCPIIAAANPIYGRYDSSLSFVENVNLTDAILSRFDCLCVVRDTVDPLLDERLGEFVVNSHVQSHAAATERDADAMNEGTEMHENVERIPQDLLRKYILFAKMNVRPQLQGVDNDKIAELYADLRRESMNSGGIPIAVRHIESIIRMAEAHAKMHLRHFVNDDDVNMAIRVMLNSFFSTQKFAVQNTLRRHFRKYLTYKQDHNDLLFHVLQDLVRDSVSYRNLRMIDGDEDAPLEINVVDFEAKAAEMGISNVAEFLKSNKFTTNGFTMTPDGATILRQNSL